MAKITEQMMLSFSEEMEKTAISWGGVTGAVRRAGGYLSRQGTTAGSGAVLGAAGGAGLGAAAGGVRGYRRAKEEGGDALLGTVGGAFGGAGTGAAIGAGLGGAAGLAGGARARGLVANLRGKQNILGKASRVGERQAHGLTGALPEGMNHAQAMKALDMGSAPKAGALADAAGAAKKYRSIGAEGLEAPGVKRLAEKAYKKEEYAREALKHQRKLDSLGATSVPGFAKALVKKPGETLRAGLGENWYGSGPGALGWGMRGVTFGLPAVGVGQALTGPDEGPEGAGRAQRVGSALGGLAFGVTGGVPMLGQMALTGLGTKGLELAGKGVDVARGTKGKKVGFEAKDWKTGLADFVPPGPEGEQVDISTLGLERLGRGQG